MAKIYHVENLLGARKTYIVFNHLDPENYPVENTIVQNLRNLFVNRFELNIEEKEAVPQISSTKDPSYHGSEHLIREMSKIITSMDRVKNGYKEIKSFIIIAPLLERKFKNDYNSSYVIPKNRKAPSNIIEIIKSFNSQISLYIDNKKHNVCSKCPQIIKCLKGGMEDLLWSSTRNRRTYNRDFCENCLHDLITPNKIIKKNAIEQKKISPTLSEEEYAYMHAFNEQVELLKKGQNYA